MLSRTDKNGGGTAYWVIIDDEGRRIVVGPAAHDAARAGAPIALGLTYQDATPSQVDDGDVDEWRSDGYGRAYVVNGALQEFTALASAARTATIQSNDLINPGAKGVILTVNTTAHAATPSITLSVQYKIPVVGTYETLFSAAAAITGSPETHSYLIYPAGVAAGHDIVEVELTALPLTWRVVMTHGDADSITYSVTGSYVL